MFSLKTYLIRFREGPDDAMLPLNPDLNLSIFVMCAAQPHLMLMWTLLYCRCVSPLSAKGHTFCVWMSHQKLDIRMN